MSGMTGRRIGAAAMVIVALAIAGGYAATRIRGRRDETTTLRSESIDRIPSGGSSASASPASRPAVQPAATPTPTPLPEPTATPVAPVNPVVAVAPAGTDEDWRNSPRRAAQRGIDWLQPAALK